MKRRHFLNRILLMGCAWAGEAQAGLTALEAQGRQFYFQGGLAIPSEPVALIGRESTRVPASAVPCAGCHGENGTGRAEGGVIPPNVTWGFLTKPYGHQHPDKRSHPAFNDRTFAAAIRQGIDPAGNKLDSAMPRYILSARQMKALLAYLKRIETYQDPGITSDTISLGTILPLKGAMAGLGEAMKGVLLAYFNRINERGGIYNRKLQLHIAEAGGTREATLANARALLSDPQVFAIVSPALSDAEAAVTAWAEREMTPLVGPLTLFPENRPGAHPSSFYLFSGINLQVRVLIDYASQNSGLMRPKVAVVYPDNGLFTEALTAVDRQTELHQWLPPRRLGYRPGVFAPSETVNELKSGGVDLLIFLGDGTELKDFFNAAEAVNWHPYILLPGSSAQNDIFTGSPALTSKVFLAFPTLPNDWSPEGIAAFNSLHSQPESDRHHLAARVATWCAAQIVVEGLKRAGRQVSRSKFIAALESLSEFDTGLTPRLTYGKNQHIGAPGAYVVTINASQKRFRPVSPWLVPK